METPPTFNAELRRQMEALATEFDTEANGPGDGSYHDEEVSQTLTRCASRIRSLLTQQATTDLPSAVRAIIVDRIKSDYHWDYYYNRGDNNAAKFKSADPELNSNDFKDYSEYLEALRAREDSDKAAYVAYLNSLKDADLLDRYLAVRDYTDRLD